jgi:hypothetical protein
MSGKGVSPCPDAASGNLEPTRPDRQRQYTPEMLADRKVLGQLGLNSREVEYLTTHPFPELASLYFAPYVDSFENEYRPFEAGLNALDQIFLPPPVCRPRSARRRRRGTGALTSRG